MKKSQKRENGQPVFDENGDPVFDYARTTYHYNYSLLRDQLLDNVNRCSFLNNNYRIYKHVMYYEAEKNNQNGGAFEQSKWTDFLSGFALGDLLLSEPTATESTFYMALEDIVKAYEKFSQVQYLVEAYDSYGKSIIEYYKENFITEKAQYEESLTSDDYFNTEVYDIDGLRAFRRVLLLYIEAMQKLSDLEANGQKDSSDYKFWAEIAKARVVDLVVAKATMPFTVHEEDDDGDGTIRFFRNDQQILNMAQQIVEKAKEYGVPIRVGVNSGSLEKHLVEKYHGVTAEGLVESALDKIQLIEEMGYNNLVVSIKSSDVMMCVKAHELIAKKCPYPLHVGITEAGTLLAGNIKSSVGLGLILGQGIGDTIRVSLTGSPLEEIKTAKIILKTLGLRTGGIEVVSCPTCGRTQIDLIGLANQVEEMVADIPLDIKVAVMGCVVNGPGEAKEADIGIAGGKGEGLLIKKGEIVKKVKEEELLETLRQELLHWNE